jgi:hypothetical protein
VTPDIETLAGAAGSAHMPQPMPYRTLFAFDRRQRLWQWRAMPSRLHPIGRHLI